VSFSEVARQRLSASTFRFAAVSGYRSSPKGPCTLTSGRCTEFGYGGEQVWNEVRFGAATGGAPSLFFPVPSFQSGLGLTSRTTPDVSYNAAINGGVLVAWSALAPAGSFIILGGTSAGAPQWAGIVALANQKRAAKGFGPLGFLNPALYAVAASASYASAFHDITWATTSSAGRSPASAPAPDTMPPRAGARRTLPT
jgi:subtilase family serine protease